MNLLTEEQITKMLANGWASAEAMEEDGNTPDHHPVVKLFNPNGAATWLLSELDPERPSIAFGLCDLGMGEPELGSVSIYELEAVVTRYGLSIERDLYFTATHPMSVYARAARKADRIVTDRTSLDAAANERGR